MATVAAKEDRLEIRMTAPAKEQVRRAALVRGQTVSEFATSVLLDASRRAIEDQQRILLSDRDRDAFFAVLDREEPNETLVNLMRNYAAQKKEAALKPLAD